MSRTNAKPSSTTKPSAIAKPNVAPKPSSAATAPLDLPWRRAIIESVSPQVDGGRFPVKRCLGDVLEVKADAFTDGHDQLRVRLQHWVEGEATDSARAEVEMVALGNDRWHGAFALRKLGRHRYVVTAWVDAFLTWRHDFARREDPADVETALQSGAMIVRAAAQLAMQRAAKDDAARLETIATRIDGDGPLLDRRAAGLSDELETLMHVYADRSRAATSEPELTVVVEPVLARFSSWYEFFPRSAAAQPGRHGTFLDCIEQLPRVAAMGFDIVYFPPIHPIGRERRKGPNNTLLPGPTDPGSPWAIGASEGGHRSIHSELGTEADFRRLVREARALGIQIALDIAFQCAPDHPYVESHPDWFRWRPDGTVQYAENPPKKYQDIYPFEFENGDWSGLFEELKGVFEHWIEAGVTVFRVDNPHTKPFAFWEWLITEIKRRHPETIFLSEAFTRPRVMHRLAKVGFSQSYTYFTWRNTRAELSEYLTEVTQHPSREYFRPNFWPNTPDILPEHLQVGGRAASIARLVLAATAVANYGVYGPAFELVEVEPRARGAEEYLDSEKYQLRHRDLEAPHSLEAFITRVNRIRRDNPALHQDWNLRLHPTDNDQIICYSKASDDLENVIVCVVSLDPYHVQSGWVDLPLESVGRASDQVCQAHDLLTDQRFLWHGDRHFVQLDPGRAPAQIFRLRRKVRSEQDFDYYL